MFRDKIYNRPRFVDILPNWKQKSRNRNLVLKVLTSFIGLPPWQPEIKNNLFLISLKVWKLKF